MLYEKCVMCGDVKVIEQNMSKEIVRSHIKFYSLFILSFTKCAELMASSVPQKLCGPVLW